VLTAQGLHDDPCAELAWLERWRERAGRSPEYRLRRGVLLEAGGRPAEAAAEYAACLELPPAHLAQNVTVRPRLGLCRLAAAAGDLADALDHAERALDHNPRDPEGLLAAVSFARAGGSLPAFLTRHRARRGESVELAQVLLACGEIDATRDTARRLCARRPEAALGVLVCNLIAGRDSDLDVALGQPEADAALTRWLTALRQSRRDDLMLAFARNASAVTGVFPWLPGWLETHAAAPADA